MLQLVAPDIFLNFVASWQDKNAPHSYQTAKRKRENRFSRWLRVKERTPQYACHQLSKVSTFWRSRKILHWKIKLCHHSDWARLHHNNLEFGPPAGSLTPSWRHAYKKHRGSCCFMGKKEVDEAVNYWNIYMICYCIVSLYALYHDRNARYTAAQLQ